MSYRFLKNSSTDFFDHTMDRILNYADRKSRRQEEFNYIAQIISGDSIGGDTTTPQENIKYVNLNGKVAMAFKIRFTEKSSKYNFVENPFPESGSSVVMTEQEKNILVSMHDDAYLEAGGLPTIPKFGDIVVCSRQDGRIFIIEKVLTNRNILSNLTFSVAGGNLSSLFGSGGIIARAGEGWKASSGTKFKDPEQEKRARKFLDILGANKVLMESGVPIYVTSAYRSSTDQAIVVAKNTISQNGANLAVYKSESYTKKYMTLAHRAIANPSGPEMKELIEYEEKIFQNALERAAKRGEIYQGHGTGYALDLNISGLNEIQKNIYKIEIQKMGATVLHETNPEHFHVNLSKWQEPPDTP